MTKLANPSIHRLTFFSLVAGLSGACTAPAPLESVQQVAPTTEISAEELVVVEAPIVTADFGTGDVDDMTPSEVEVMPTQDKAETDTRLAVAQVKPARVDAKLDEIKCDPRFAPEDCSDDEWNAWNAGE